MSDEQIPQTLSTDTLARRSRSAKVRYAEFLRGPVPLWWLTGAASIPGKALAVGISLWFKAGVTGSHEVKLNGPLLKRFGVERKAYYAALRSLTTSG